MCYNLIISLTMSVTVCILLSARYLLSLLLPDPELIHSLAHQIWKMFVIGNISLSSSPRIRFTLCICMYPHTQIYNINSCVFMCIMMIRCTRADNIKLNWSLLSMRSNDYVEHFQTISITIGDFARVAVIDH